ncbi:MAG: winged helix-turn-helix transcriptional regulator [Candidatus Nitrosocosmicus sp.]
MYKSKANEFRSIIFKVVSSTPGIRYNDIIRTTKFNHGVLSYSLDVLEKKDLVKSIRCSNDKITRYYSTSIPDEYFSIIGYLKNKTTRQIILFLYDSYKEKNFTEIKIHINKASSTTSWNIKRLSDDNIIIRIESKRSIAFRLAQPQIASKILDSFDNLILDRTYYDAKIYARMINPFI